MRVLIVVDMQNDFVDGVLGSAQAKAIVPAVVGKIAEYRSSGDRVVFTRDTHGNNYLETQEGRKLPVPHCIRESYGWQIVPQIDTLDSIVIDKPSFGSCSLMEVIYNMEKVYGVDSVEIVGLCTDICVISNAMLAKAQLPEVPVTVDASCCAGVTPESHETALSAMEMCQIDIINR